MTNRPSRVAVRRPHDPPASPPADDPPPFDPDDATIGQLRRRLLAEATAGDDPMPLPVRERARALLDALRRVAPSPLLVAGHDADAALLLDGRGLAELSPHGPRPGLLVLRVAGGRGRA